LSLRLTFLLHSITLLLQHNATQRNTAGIMGMVFGKSTVAEPSFKVLYEHSKSFEYEIRKYGERYAAEASYKGSDDSPFGILAKYIGVFGSPENEGTEAISMTAPVVMQSKATAIAMTAPVVETEDQAGQKTMQFILPAKYDSLENIPKPTNPAVHIKTIPPQVGAVHRYSGSHSESRDREIATELATQLQNDGVDVSVDYVLANYQFWAYNPPFTIPMLRRNELWVELSAGQVETLLNGFSAEEAN
jgi:hypothetical protein